MIPNYSVVGRVRWAYSTETTEDDYKNILRCEQIIEYLVVDAKDALDYDFRLPRFFSTKKHAFAFAKEMMKSNLALRMCETRSCKNARK